MLNTIEGAATNRSLLFVRNTSGSRATSRVLQSVRQKCRADYPKYSQGSGKGRFCSSFVPDTKKIFESGEQRKRFHTYFATSVLLSTGTLVPARGVQAVLQQGHRCTTEEVEKPIEAGSLPHIVRWQATQFTANTLKVRCLHPRPGGEVESRGALGECFRGRKPYESFKP